jgi:hypothetical protein
MNFFCEGASVLKNIFALVSLLIFGGGCSCLDHEPSQSDLSSCLNAIYFTPIFLETKEHGEIDIKNAIKELSRAYTFTSCADFSAKYAHRSGGSCNGGFVACEYLGRYEDTDLVYRRYETGGTGTFSDIVLCSKKGNTFRVHDVILSGDRAIDGMMPHPVYDEDGNIYFYSYLSGSTLLKQAGIAVEDHDQCYSCYYAVGKCVYTLKTKKTEILGIDIIIQDDNSESKIKTFLRRTVKGDRRILNKNEVKTFLRELRELYLSEKSTI